jgi:hypothetical protein
MSVRAHMAIWAVLLGLAHGVPLRADDDESDTPSPTSVPAILRPATLEARIADFFFTEIERKVGPKNEISYRISLRFTPKGRTLFVEHVPLYRDRGDSDGPRRIDLEIGIKRELTPVRFVVIDRDGQTTAETILLRAADGDFSKEEGAGFGAMGPPMAMCPAYTAPPTFPQQPGEVRTSLNPEPPLGRRISVVPSVFWWNQTATDRSNGGVASFGASPSIGLAASGAVPWTDYLESLFEVAAGQYQFASVPGGLLLDKQIAFFSFQTGVRYYFASHHRTYLDALVGYDRRFFIRGAGSGFFAAAPFDFPQLTLRFGVTLIPPQRRWGMIAEFEARASQGLWKSNNLKLGTGVGGDFRVEGTLRHPLARLRFGASVGYEHYEANLVNLQMVFYRFQMGMDWEL